MVKWHHSFLLTLLVFLKLTAQGTVNLTNIGPGFGAPIIGPDGPLRGDHFATLALEGTWISIAGPTPFLANGLFAGGTTRIAGVPPGETIRVWLVVTASDGSVVGSSEPFSVTLGGSGTPPSLPGQLMNLNPFSVDDSRRTYVWAEPRILPGTSPVRISSCKVRDPIILIDVYVDESFCIDEDEQIKTRSETMLIRTPKLEHSISREGSLELRWLAGSPLVLFGTSSLNSPAKLMTGDIYRDGYRVLTVTPDSPQQFFWLQKPKEANN